MKEYNLVKQIEQLSVVAVVICNKDSWWGRKKLSP